MKSVSRVLWVSMSLLVVDKTSVPPPSPRVSATPSRVRLYEQIRELGYDSLTAFANARPAVPLVALADELGEDDITGMRILSELLAEAKRSHQVTRFVRDVLVRELSECLPDGWPVVLDGANRSKVDMALGSWAAFTPETHEERVRQARETLRATPPPPGWRPLGPDDELLRTLLPDETI